MKKNLICIFAVLTLVWMLPTAEAANWYLHANSSSWDTLTGWWSAPVGGTNPTALSGSDTYNCNGWSLTTPELTTSTTFGGGHLIVNGMAGVWGGEQASGYLGLKCKGATSTITIPDLVCSGGPTRTISDNTGILGGLIVNNFTVSDNEYTQISNGTSGRLFNLTVGTLKGNGDLNVIGSGSTALTITSATNFNGTIYITGNATVPFQNSFVSSGALVVEQGSQVILNGNITVTALVVSGSTNWNAGLVGDIDTGTALAGNTTYSYAQLSAAYPAIFTGGTGSITVTQPTLIADASNVVSNVGIGQLSVNSGDAIFWNAGTPDYATRMLQANIGLARIGGYPKHGGSSESLAQLDMYVTQTLNAGAQPLFIQFIDTQADNPAFMASLLNLNGVSGTNSGATVGTNCAYLVQHYMAPPFNLTTQYWEVGNEPDIATNYQVASSQEYINFYQSVHDQLVATGVRGNVQLCGPVTSFEYGFGANGGRSDSIMEDFLTACAAPRNGYNQVDVVTRHVYPYIYSWETSDPGKTADSAYNLLNAPCEMVTFTQQQVTQHADRGEGDIQAMMNSLGYPPTVGTGITEMNVSGTYQRTMTQGMWFLTYDHYGLYNPRNQLGMGYTYDRADSDWGYFDGTGAPNYAYWATYIHGVLTGDQVLKQSSTDPHLLITASKDPTYVYVQVLNRGLNDITAGVALNNAPVTGSPTLYQLSSTATPATGTATTLGTNFTYTFPAMTAQIFRYLRSDAPTPPAPWSPPTNVVLNTAFATAPSGMQVYSSGGFTPSVTGTTLKLTNTTANATGAVIFNGQPLTSAASRAQVRFGYRIDSGHSGTGFVLGAYSSSPLATGSGGAGLGFYGQPNQLWGVKLQNKGTYPDEIGIVPNVMNSAVDGWAVRALAAYPTNYFMNMYAVINYDGNAGTVNALLYQGTSDTTGTLVANITNRLGNPSSLPAGSVFGFTGATTSFSEVTSIQNLSIAADNTAGTTPSAPVITSATATQANVGMACSYQIAATNNPTGYEASGLPTGLSVNSATGLISGSAASTGTSLATICAINAGGTGSATLTITVLPPSPAITSALTATGTNGATFSYQILATNSPTSFSATGLPTGLSVDTVAGVISGTATQIGTFTTTLSATNANGTGSAPLVLTILPSPPVITGTLRATGTSGSAFSFQIAATNAPAAFNATGLPTGLGVDTGAGLISGTPTQSGTFNVALSAINAGGTGSAILVLTVQPPPPVITSVLTAAGTNGSAFSYQITATNSPTGYNATGLPSGLTVTTGTGLISGIPTQTGTFNATISAINLGGSSSATLILTVLPPALIITSSNTASGTVGLPFGYQITATNGPSEFNATGLPSGISVNTSTGLISGTPAQAGLSNVTLSATNANGSASAALVLTVQTPNLPPPWSNQDVGSVGITGTTTYSAGTFTVSGEGIELMNAGTADAFQYVSQPASGDCSITARVATLSSPGDTGKGEGGVMIRNGLTSNSMFMSVGVSAGRGLQFTYRLAASGTSVDVYGTSGTAPYWVRVVRSGSTFTGYTSPDNITWSQVGASQTINMGTGVYIGMISTNHGSQLCTATLDNIAAITTVAPTITSSTGVTTTVGMPFSYQITAANNPVSYSESGLPTGLGLNSATGLISGTTTAAGTNTATINAINTGGTGSGTLTITSQNPFTTWKATYFTPAKLLDPSVSGDKASPAGDGISNLMKYALELNPNTDGAGGLPVAGLLRTGSSNYLTLSYTQVISATDITYTVEVSGNLQTWNSGSGYTLPVSATNNSDGVTQTVVVQDLTPLSSGSRRFIRLRVTNP